MGGRGIFNFFIRRFWGSLSLTFELLFSLSLTFELLFSSFMSLFSIVFLLLFSSFTSFFSGDIICESFSVFIEVVSFKSFSSSFLLSLMVLLTILLLILYSLLLFCKFMLLIGSPSISFLTYNSFGFISIFLFPFSILSQLYFLLL